MVDISTITVPLVIIAPEGKKHLAAACFRHKFGLLYLDLDWFRSTPEKSAHLIRGELSGDGPWKIDGHVIRVLGCHGTDPELQDSWQTFQDNLRHTETTYPPRQQIAQIARRLGGIMD